MTMLPTRRLEDWRYTDLRPLAAISFARPLPAPAPADLPDLGIPRLVFVNGVFFPSLSTADGLHEGFAPPAADAALPLVRINAEHARDGATLRIPANADAGAVLLVSYAHAEAPVEIHPRHRIVLEQGAKLTLIELALGQGTYWHNPVTEIRLGRSARLRHYRLQDEAPDAFHLATIEAALDAEAEYDGVSLVLGAKLSRTEFHVDMHAAGAAAHLSAAQLLRGRQHGDVTAVIGHRAPSCASRQIVKSVLADAARGVFQGRIEVDRGAQKTDGYQMNQALLLSAEAEMDVKPELRIYADDVKCSHGATIGALDPEQLFYLRSRGIPEAEARQMLVHAFLSEALETIAHEAARTLFEDRVARWWAA